MLLSSSHLGPGLVSLSSFPWVGVGGVVELTVVVLGVEVSFHGVGDSEEVGHGSLVGDVRVQVVLEVLEHVHVLVDDVVSSDSWEREGTVVEFPGVD